MSFSRSKSADPYTWEYRLSYAVWLYFRFPLSLRMVEEVLAARGVDVTYETLRAWALKCGHQVAKRIRARVRPLATSGISMRCSSPSTESATSYGGRWINMAMFWSCLYKAGATANPPSDAYAGSHQPATFIDFCLCVAKWPTISCIAAITAIQSKSGQYVPRRSLPGMR